MQLICSHCANTLIGPPSLIGTRCPSCGEGELGSPGRAPIETVLAVNGWAEVLDIVSGERASSRSGVQAAGPRLVDGDCNALRLTPDASSASPLAPFTPERREHIRRDTDHIGRGVQP